MQRSSSMQMHIVEKCMHNLITQGLGLDLSDPNLSDTPKRVARMLCNEFFESLDKLPPKVTVFPNDKNYDEIIMLDNVPYSSTCAHHFVTFGGLAWFLYVPDKTLAGASKIARIIHYFSKKPQIQERLSREIVDFFVDKVQPKGVMLVMRGTHQCMSCRGVKTGNDAGMLTSVLHGCFKDDPAARDEGLQLIQMSITDRR
jgi:GTP cyclohydrolase IA